MPFWSGKAIESERSARTASVGVTSTGCVSSAIQVAASRRSSRPGDRHRTAPGPVRSHRGPARTASRAPPVGCRGSAGRSSAVGRPARHRELGVGGATDGQQRLPPVGGEHWCPHRAARICQKGRFPCHRHVKSCYQSVMLSPAEATNRLLPPPPASAAPAAGGR